MPFKLLAYNRLRDGGELAAELPPSQSGLRRWMAIYPYLRDGTAEFDHFRIVDFELTEEDVDEYFNKELRRNNRKLDMPSERELYDFLESNGIEPAVFDAPWHCNYPDD